MTPKKLVCFECKHFDELSPGCAAFPDGIPDAITSGQNKHKKPISEQGNNLVFSKL